MSTPPPRVQRGSRRSPAFPALLAALAAVFLGVGARGGEPAQAAERSGAGLVAFRSDADLRRFLKRRFPPAPIPPLEEGYGEDQLEAVVVTGSRTVTANMSTASPNITNRQEAEVDEGGIVKVRGDILVILRRGRLFTVSLARGQMQPVDSIDAFPPGVNANGDWYDEMLLAGDRVVVIGYSYGRGGTEINRFRIDDAGRLRFEDAHHLRSNDYYSSRNYASRLVGDTLVVYAPLELDWKRDPLEALPGIRRWTGDEDAAFKRIGGGRQVYIPRKLRHARDAEIEALHSVIRCDLAAPALDCEATSVLGPEARTFYVSGQAVYLWLSDWTYERENAPGLLYRLPLSGRRPTAIGVRGAPLDQFSFREDRSDAVLNVLVGPDGDGDAMWRAEFREEPGALLRIPLDDFGDGSREAARSHYRFFKPLAPEGEAVECRNRFVGEYALFGCRFISALEGDRAGPARGRLVAAPVRGGALTELELPHGVDRIEVLGRDALVVGGRGADVVFTAIDISPGQRPRPGDSYTVVSASEAESRSHAFFFRPDTADGASGVLGLPVARAGRPAHHELFENSAAMLFLQRHARRFSPLGELASEPAGAVDDQCTASCVDWYGNARPIFLGQRVFALLGYELVEGVITGGAIREVGRVSYAPAVRPE
jgi:hypothetical protein